MPKGTEEGEGPSRHRLSETQGREGDSGSRHVNKQGTLGVLTPPSGSKLSPNLTTQPSPAPPKPCLPSCSWGPSPQ